MVFLEAAVVIGLVGALVYWTVRLLMPPQEQRQPAVLTGGTWRVAHYDVKGQTRVVLQRVSQGGVTVHDEHVIATIPADDPEYDERFIAAMNTARQRQALFEAEEGA